MKNFADLYVGPNVEIDNTFNLNQFCSDTDLIHERC